MDWQVMKIRAARDTYTRGRMREVGKSTKAGRGVPMAPRVAREPTCTSSALAFRPIRTLSSRTRPLADRSSAPRSTGASSGPSRAPPSGRR